MKTLQAIALIAAWSLFSVSAPNPAQGGENGGIGVVTAVQGEVTVDHPDPAEAIPVKIQDDVIFQDVFETRDKSRTKVLFDNESLLTIGENSKIEITEHIYDPAQNKRSMVVKLLQGKVRALVGKVFAESGSKFEIHTPTAVAAARGTYFVVWVEGQTSGVVNIGKTGRVDFSSAGQTVNLAPNHFSMSVGGSVPSVPGLVSQGAPTVVATVVRGTELRDSPKTEAATEAVAAVTAAKILSEAGAETKAASTVRSSSGLVTGSTTESETNSGNKDSKSKSAVSDQKDGRTKAGDRASNRKAIVKSLLADQQKGRKAGGPSGSGGQVNVPVLTAPVQGQGAGQSGGTPSFAGGAQGEGSVLMGGGSSFAGGRASFQPPIVPTTPPATVSGAADSLLGTNVGVTTSTTSNSGSSGSSGSSNSGSSNSNSGGNSGSSSSTSSSSTSNSSTVSSTSSSNSNSGNSNSNSNSNSNRGNSRGQGRSRR